MKLRKLINFHANNDNYDGDCWKINDLIDEVTGKVDDNLMLNGPFTWHSIEDSSICSMIAIYIMMRDDLSFNVDVKPSFNSTDVVITITEI